MFKIYFFLNYLKKPIYAEEFFLLSFGLCKKIIQIQPDLCVIEQDIVWLAKLHNIFAKIQQGKIDDARGELIQMISKNMIAIDFSPPPSWAIERAKTALTQIG